MLTTVIGLFETPQEARLVVTGLTNQGLEKTVLKIMTSEQSVTEATTEAFSGGPESKGQDRLLDRMRGFGVPMSKLDYYTETVCSGGALVSAKVDLQKAEDIHVSMAEHGALETVEADRATGPVPEEIVVGNRARGAKAGFSPENIPENIPENMAENVLADEPQEELTGKVKEPAARSLGADSSI